MVITDVHATVLPRCPPQSTFLPTGLFHLAGLLHVLHVLLCWAQEWGWMTVGQGGQRGGRVTGNGAYSGAVTALGLRAVDGCDGNCGASTFQEKVGHAQIGAMENSLLPIPS